VQSAALREDSRVVLVPRRRVVGHIMPAMISSAGTGAAPVCAGHGAASVPGTADDQG
jgi:hypothetical protein